MAMILLFESGLRCHRRFSQLLSIGQKILLRNTVLIGEVRWELPSAYLLVA